MAGKILTVIPLLVLSGLFFAAGIIEAGVLFVAFATVVLLAFLRAGRAGGWLSREEASEIEARTAPVPGAPRRGISGGGSGT